MSFFVRFPKGPKIFGFSTFFLKNQNFWSTKNIWFFTCPGTDQTLQLLVEPFGFLRFGVADTLEDVKAFCEIEFFAGRVDVTLASQYSAGPSGYQGCRFGF